MTTPAPGVLSTVPFNEPGKNPFAVSGYTSSRLLAASTHEEITIPAKALYVRIAATDDIYYSFTGNAAVPTDIDDGSACELINKYSGGEWRMVPPGATALSVISAGTPIVTASFYTA